MLVCLLIEITFVGEVLGSLLDAIARLIEDTWIGQGQLELGVEEVIDHFQKRILSLVTPDSQKVVHVKRPNHGTAQAQVHDVLDFNLEATHIIEANPLNGRMCVQKLAGVSERNLLLLDPDVSPVFCSNFLANFIVRL